MKKYIGVCLLLFVQYGFAQLNITPMPVSVKTAKGNFSIDRNTVFVLKGGGLEKSVYFLNHYLQQYAGFSLKTSYKHTGANAITLNFERMDNNIPGAYKMNIDSKGIYIAGDKVSGVFHGIQTLIQLLPVDSSHANGKTTVSLPVPYVAITDYPRFAYRGMHLDVGRHLYPLDFIKKYIDYLAYYKYNYFHWHLTEDQGWRIEIKKYPLLTQVGSCRERTLVGRYGSNTYDSTKYCGFYTQDQIKEIVQYAADRYITIIPEIEMPGHSTAALASYPYLGCTKGPYKVMDTWGVLDDVYCAGNDSTFTFLQNVLDEVIKLFPSEYIHIGGDECPKERWKTCPLCQKRIKDEHLKDEHALQSYFIQRIEKYLNKKGRRIIGWDEILEGGLAPNATVMSWRGEEGGIAAAKDHHDVIMTPGTYCYLDHSQTKNEDSITIGGYLPLEKVYSYEPIPKELNETDAKHVLGAQGNVWTEYMDNPSKVEYMIFPRMSALSEVLWSPAKNRNWNDFERRLPGLFNHYQLWGTNYSKAYYDLAATVMPTDNYDGILWKLESKDSINSIRYQESWAAKDTLTYVKLIRIATQGGLYTAWQKNSAPIRQIFSINKATGKKITLVNEPGKSYPGNGAFTLVDGIINVKGLARSSEFLGFLGKDLDATIDLGTTIDISKVTLHLLGQNGSWIYLPSQIEVSYLPDAALTPEVSNNAPKQLRLIDPVKDKNAPHFVFQSSQHCRYIRIVARNYGIIPPGNPGAGKPAWLFVNEIEVD